MTEVTDADRELAREAHFASVLMESRERCERIAQAIAAAREAEREQFAKIANAAAEKCERECADIEPDGADWHVGYRCGCRTVAARIRSGEPRRG